MAFNLNGERWNHTTITWSIATNNFSGQPGGAFSNSISDPIIINDITNAFNQWDAASGLSFVRVADASNVDIRLGFGTVDGSGGSIGRANFSFDSNTNFFRGTTVRFDSAEDYFTQNGEVFVNNTNNPITAVALHEIGHDLGLEHIDAEPAVMNSSAGTNTTLRASDIQGIQFLYPNTTPPPPPSSSAPVNFNGHTYQFVSFNGTATSWQQAREAAAAMGGHLATITSEAENSFIQSQLLAGESSIATAFIGASDAGQETIWQWVTGPEAGATFWNGSAVPGQFANWASGEPNNITSNPDGSENFGVISQSGTWLDVASLRDPAATTGFIVEFSSQTTTPTPTPTSHVSTDFDKDGDSDLLFRQDSGTLRIYTMQSDHVQSAVTLGNLGNDFRFQGTGDFDNDSDSDLLFRQDNGALRIYSIENDHIQSVVNLGNLGNEFRFQGTGDFNHDGDSDLLFRQDNGTLRIYTMQNAQTQSAVTLGNLGNEFRFLATGDFDHDGDSDLLFRQDNGALRIYTMQNNQLQSAINLGSLGNEFRFLGTGDFDKDGDSDLLFRQDNGTLRIYTMQNTQIQSAVTLGNLGNEFSFQTTGDFDKDGDGDLLFRQDNGSLRAYTMENNHILTAVDLGNLGNDFHILV